MRTLARLAGLAVFLAWAPALAQQGNHGRIPWMENFDEGMALAKRTGKPVILFFTADW